MIVHKNPYFSINLENDYYSINFQTEHVIILPILDNKIVLIKSIRPIFSSPIIELPAGAVDINESPKIAALREFHEETGILVSDTNRLKKLPSLNNIPSRTNHLINVFSIDISLEEYNNRLNHDSEVSAILLMSFEEVIKSINKGEFFTSPFIAICLIHIINSNQLK